MKRVHYLLCSLFIGLILRIIPQGLEVEFLLIAVVVWIIGSYPPTTPKEGKKN